ncbi:phosphatidate cytidylyltransferase [Bacillus sp. 165]|uniref:phosphatidate cytidylyltransferase n=1 Tax=Bacillus sp. 165 TaxID=1529117 RepID=UPI001ADCEC8C|nr:phosphatidate cytidylyltransferase [Bacillus sp. 165]MBO9128852.1 phosphatidate cytidylyltransferase [Bacillus sp. 165]
MKQRIITGVVAAALFLPIVIYGGIPFTLLIYVLATIGLFELIRMKKLSFFSAPSILTMVLLWIILMPNTMSNYFEGFWLSKVELTFIIVLLLLSYTVLSKNTFTFDDASFMLLSTLYVAMGFYYFNETRNAVEGLSYVFYALFVIWATDSGAYFIGKAIGKNKLWPEISPNKTIEGSLGGIVCGVVVAVIYNVFIPLHESLFVVIAMTIFVSIFGQIGDLVESAFKRHYGVKDSGTILPGHGGILDRFDSLLFVMPVLHFLHFIS